MPTFFQGLLITVMLFAFCFSISLGVKVVLLWIKYKRENATPEEPETKNESPKIYYVKETVKPKRKKRKVKKSPDLALKGVILTPEQFKTVERENTDFNL